MPRIKGNHNAMLSGICAAETAYQALKSGRANDELNEYEEKIKSGPVFKDLLPVRNVKPLWSRLGLLFGITLGALDMWFASIFGFNLFGTMKHKCADHEVLKSAGESKKIDYANPYGKISF